MFKMRSFSMLIKDLSTFKQDGDIRAKVSSQIKDVVSALMNACSMEIAALIMTLNIGNLTFSRI